jgi:hypothetical protein
LLECDVPESESLQSKRLSGLGYDGKKPNYVWIDDGWEWMVDEMVDEMDGKEMDVMDENDG